MSHRSVEGPMVLCKPSSRRTAGAWPGQGGREMQGPRKTAIFGGGGGGGVPELGRAGKGFQAVCGKLCGQPPCLQASSHPWP